MKLINQPCVPWLHVHQPVAPLAYLPTVRTALVLWTARASAAQRPGSDTVPLKTEVPAHSSRQVGFRVQTKLE